LKNIVYSSGRQNIIDNFLNLSHILAQPAPTFVLRNQQLTFTIMEKRTEQRKHFLHCNIAGFMYWDGFIELFAKTINRSHR